MTSTNLGGNDVRPSRWVVFILFRFSSLVKHDFLNRFIIFSPSLIISNGLVHTLCWKDVEMQTPFFKLELGTSVAQCVTPLKALHFYGSIFRLRQAPASSEAEHKFGEHKFSEN